MVARRGATALMICQVRGEWVNPALLKNEAHLVLRLLFGGKGVLGQQAGELTLIGEGVGVVLPAGILTAYLIEVIT